MYIGSHVSIRTGYLAAAKRAVQIGGKAFQYFPKNPRSLAYKTFNQEDARACAAYCHEHGLKSIAHTPYPTNLCPTSKEMRRLTVQSVLNDLDIANQCGSLGVVVHFGKWKGPNKLEGYQLMIDVLNEILEQWEGRALILLENNAGQSVKMGITLEELVQVRELCLEKEKLGFCLDTCHAFASGLWNGQNWDSFIRKAEEIGYLEHLCAIHVNDSAYPALSYRDRHANIGYGEIGLPGFVDLFSRREFRQIPCILETPTTATYSHAQELEYISKLFS